MSTLATYSDTEGGSGGGHWLGGLQVKLNAPIGSERMRVVQRQCPAAERLVPQ